MFPPDTPARVERAHRSIVPIYAFLETYQAWKSAGRDDACDFALGNPHSVAPEPFVSALRDAVTPRSADWYAYKINERPPRDLVAASLRDLTGLAFEAEDVFLTNGATGALQIVFNALIGPGDEAIVNHPPWFFYDGMILNAGGLPVRVATTPSTFDLDLAAIERAITAKTRLVIVNSPNNPTGKVYGEATLAGLSEILTRAERKHETTIHLVSDEAYRAVVYDGARFVSPAKFHDRTIVIYTYGKTLLTPGQRIGYAALSPRLDGREALRRMLTSSQILCGWAVASALMQHALPALEHLSPDMADLQARRDRLVAGLRDGGYETRAPEGAFYITPKTPIADDAAFAGDLARLGVYCLPGSVVQMPGHLRISVTANDAMIDRALPRFAAARAAAAG